MSLVTFQDRTFLDYKGHWFLWEPSWESFRPIDAVQWDGVSFVIDDRAYCKDPLDELYGYGTRQAKEVCDRLAPLRQQRAVAIETPVIGKSEWFRDRNVALHPCAPRDKESWKRMCRGRVHTCRRPLVRNKFTRRNLRHS
jgi:hypothetical protein